MITSSRAVEDHATGLEPGLLLTMYRRMALARAVDLRAWTLSRQGRAHFVITSRGHEAAQVGAAMALDPGRDWLVPYYRSLAMVLGLGMSAKDALLSIFARATDPNSGGRQLPMHFSYPPLRIVSGSSVVATQIPHATGLALAAKLAGEPAVALAAFGEGGSTKGDFHEGLNFAAIHRLSAIFFCENNGYAISVPQAKQMNIVNVAERAAAYGMAGVTVDGNDPVAVYEAVSAARTRALTGNGPTLVEARVYRFMPHSSDDDDRPYRSREEVAEATARDPLPAFAARLRALDILSEGAEATLQAEVQAEVDAAVDFGEAQPQPGAFDLLTHVFAEDTPWR